MPELENAKYERFCRAYAKDRNGTDAAIACGYSKRSAHVQASRMLKDVKVQLRIKELEKKTLDKLDVSVERIVKEYAKLAFFDPRKLFDKHGNLLSVADLDDDTAAAINSFEMGAEIENPKKRRKKKGEDGQDEPEPPPIIHKFIKKIRTSDKKGALDSLARLKGMFVDKHEITGKDGQPIEVTETVSPVEAARRVAFLLASAAHMLQEKK